MTLLPLFSLDDLKALIETVSNGFSSIWATIRGFFKFTKSMRVLLLGFMISAFWSFIAVIDQIIAFLQNPDYQAGTLPFHDGLQFANAIFPIEECITFFILYGAMRWTVICVKLFMKVIALLPFT